MTTSSETTSINEVSLLMKVQTAGKSWNDETPEELRKLHDLLLSTGYEVSWPPRKLGINLLTPNKIRGISLKRVLMKLYPFDTFWKTDTLDETLQKCLLVCQQLGMNVNRSLVWGRCSMDSSYSFWIDVLKRVPQPDKTKSEEDYIEDAKSKVIDALIATRGLDWDKKIAQNFEDSLGRSRLFVLAQTYFSGQPQPQEAQTPRLKFKPQLKASGNDNWRTTFQNIFEANRGAGFVNQPRTTSSFASALKQESNTMIEILHKLERHYSHDCVLQIEKAFEYGAKVVDLADKFDGYMRAHNRGAFRDVYSLANHTDKVIKAVSKLTTAYQDFFMEFQKYFSNGRGDEYKLPPFSYVTELGKKSGN